MIDMQLQLPGMVLSLHLPIGIQTTLYGKAENREKIN
jgi:hypothetical protein